MLELPEAMTLQKQLTTTIKGKQITKVTAGASPHKFAFYCGDPAQYDRLLSGQAIDRVEAFGGLVEIHAGNRRILFGDGVGMRYFAPGEKLPAKHQLR